MHVPIDAIEKTCTCMCTISAMRMHSERNCLTCKHKLQLHVRESIFRSLVRLKDAAKVVYIMLRDNRGVRIVQLKLR